MQPRERYECAGPRVFGDVELIALVIGTGAGGRSAMEIAAEVVHRFGGLGGMASTSLQELRAIPGLGLARAVRLHAGLHAGRRSLQSWIDLGSSVRGSVDAYRHFGPPMRGLAVEELHALYLDRRSRPMGYRVLTSGNDAYTIVDPRQIFQPAVRMGAFSLILAHNHPSGDVTPASGDIEVTYRVASAGRLLGISVLDHLVVGQGTYASMAERGDVEGLGHAVGGVVCG